MYEYLIDRLRCIAAEMDSRQTTRRTLYQAADALENQDKQVKAQQDLIEKLKKKGEIAQHTQKE